jgi:hypothetical protein
MSVRLTAWVSCWRTRPANATVAARASHFGWNRKRPNRENISRSAGSSVIVSTAATTMARVLVYASGRNSRPSCASRVSTGRNDTAITSSAKKLGPPTSFTASRMTSRYWSPPPLLSHSSNFLCVCSTTTMAASTSAPIAIAIPPSDKTGYSSDFISAVSRAGDHGEHAPR